VKELTRDGGHLELRVGLRTDPPQVIDVTPLEVGTGGERSQFVAVGCFQGRCPAPDWKSGKPSHQAEWVIAARLGTWRGIPELRAKIRP